MRRLNCPKCGNGIMWDERGERVRCPVCGAQYRMHPGSRGRGVRLGTGGEAPIEITQGRYAGAALVKSFAPKGWRMTTNAPEAESNLLVPLTPQVEYAAPDGGAFITYTGARAYNHLEPTPQNAPQQGRMALPDRMISLAYRDADAICEGMLKGNPNLQDVRVLSSFNQPDPWAERFMRNTVEEYARAGTLNPGGSWAKRYCVALDRNRGEWHKLIEVMVTCAFLPVPPQEQQLYQMMLATRARAFPMGGMFGMRQPPIEPPQPKLRWTVNYVVETSAKKEAFTEAMRYHEQIRNSFSPLPLFEQESARIRDALLLQTMQETNAINDALSQMNRDNMASWDRRQQIIRETSDYGTQVMRDMRESTAQTHQRVNNLRSEAIRGVNTYYTHNTGYGEPSVVEASTRWDHVYQNRRHPDTYAAHTGDAPLEFGVDFEELERTDGDY